MSYIEIILYCNPLNPLKKQSANDQRILIKDDDGGLVEGVKNTLLNDCSSQQFGSHVFWITVDYKTKMGIQKMVGQYSSQDKNFYKLSAYIDKLDNEEGFYIIFNSESSFEERIAAKYTLLTIHPGEAVDQRLFSRILMQIQRMSTHLVHYSFGFDDIEFRSGTMNKSQRICRFCGNSGEHYFKKIAHAIPEAIGNKTLFCNEECDDCNSRLGKIEEDFVHLMDMRRALNKLSWKGGTSCPTIYGKNFAIHPNENGNPELFLKQELLPAGLDTNNPFNIRLENSVDIVDENIYKALTKMVLDLLPNEELTHFKQTVAWINGRLITESLPDIYVGYSSNPVVNHPCLDVYIKSPSVTEDIPYCTAILFVSDIAYMFVVPLVDIDMGKFKYNNQVSPHLERIKSFFQFTWEKQDFLDHHSSSTWLDLKVEPKNNNIHILPASDTHFNKPKRPLNTRTQDISFPLFEDSCVEVLTVEKAKFKDYSKRKIAKKDLSDVSVLYQDVTCELSPKQKTVRLSLTLLMLNSNQDEFFFKTELTVLLSVVPFEKYIQIDTSDQSFALDYHLRDCIFSKALVAGEKILRVKRRGSDFYNCTIQKPFEDDRVKEVIIYHVNVNGKVWKVSDKMLHCLKSYH